MNFGYPLREGCWNPEQSLGSKGTRAWHRMFPSTAQSPGRTGWVFWLPPNIGKFGCSSRATSSRAKHGWVWSSNGKKLEGLCPRRFPVLCGTWLGGNSYWAWMCVSVVSVWSALVRGLFAMIEKGGRGLACPGCSQSPGGLGFHRSS